MAQSSVLGGLIRERLRNQPNGFAGLDGDGDLLGTLINRSMTYAELMAGVIPEAGEIVYCTDTRDIHVGDGATVGGRFLSGPFRTAAITNVNTQITDASAKNIFTLAVKANCEYMVRAIISIFDVDGTRNNGEIQLDFGASAVPTLAYSAVPFWSTTSTLETVYALRTSTGSVLIVRPPTTPILSFQQNIYIEFGIKPTTDTNLIIRLKQQVASASFTALQSARIGVL